MLILYSGTHGTLLTYYSLKKLPFILDLLASMTNTINFPTHGPPFPVFGTGFEQVLKGSRGQIG